MRAGPRSQADIGLARRPPLDYMTSGGEQRDKTDRVAMIRVLLVGDLEGGYATLEAAVSAAVGMVPVGRARPDAGLWLQLQHARPDVVVIDHEPPSSEKLVLCHRSKSPSTRPPTASSG